MIKYKDFFTPRALRRQPSAIRALQPLLSLPGMISLGGGLPNPATFPFQSLSCTLDSGHTIQLTSKRLEKALQYSETPGLPALVEKMELFQQHYHQLPAFDEPQRALAITTGSQDGLAKVFDMLLTSQDTLLLEAPSYSGSLAFLKPLNCQLQGLPTDAHGLLPEALDECLRTWCGGKRPQVLYVIPTASNPTGTSYSLERKQAIYNLACKYNLLIMEDDPYYFIQFRQHRLDSFLHLDHENRVIRFDSFSKIVSAGLRIGMVTGPKEVIECMNLATQASNLHVSGIAQTLMLELLEDWGHDGFEEHVAKVTDLYRERRDLFLECAEYHLKDLATWDIPSGGMFAWLNLKDVEDSAQLIQEKAIQNKVLLVPGNVFYPQDNFHSSYVRASYSTATGEQMNQALERLARLLVAYHEEKHPTRSP